MNLLMILGWILLYIMAVIFILALMRIGSEADERDERMFREWERQHGYKDEP